MTSLLANGEMACYEQSMNILSAPKRCAILERLLAGVAHAAVAEEIDVSLNTVAKLAFDRGQRCATYQSQLFVRLPFRHIQVRWPRVPRLDQDHELVMHVAVVPEVMLVPVWMVGKKGSGTAYGFAQLICRRWETRPAITFDRDSALARQVVSAINQCVPTLADFAARVAGRCPCSTHPEKSSRRLARFDALVALHFASHNFMILGPRGATPAMEAGLATRPWTVEDVDGLPH
jgi:hypothetical protein